jgi:hypothetical protein
MGNRASPSVRCDYLSCTSAVYSHPCIHTVRSFTQYNLSSIRQYPARAHCSPTATIEPDSRLSQYPHRPFLQPQPVSLVSALGSAHVVIWCIVRRLLSQPAALHYDPWPSLAPGPSITSSLTSTTGYGCNIYSPVTFSIELDNQHT